MFELVRIAIRPETKGPEVWQWTLNGAVRAVIVMGAITANIHEWNERMALASVPCSPFPTSARYASAPLHRRRLYNGDRYYTVCAITGLPGSILITVNETVLGES